MLKQVILFEYSTLVVVVLVTRVSEETELSAGGLVELEEGLEPNN